MSAITDPAQELIDVLEQSITGLTRLYETLIAERASFGLQDADRITSLADEKVTLLSEIRHLDLQRDRLLEGQGYAPNLEGISDLFKNHPIDRDYVPVIDEFLIRVRECAEANQVNNAIVQSRLRYTQKIIGLIRGRDVDFRQYNRSGSQDGYHGGKTIACV